VTRATSPLFPHALFLFGIYAVILFFATHWPRLALPLGPIPRPDLLQHLVAFGVWSALFTACGIFGRWNSGRNIAWSLAVGILYACIDEGLQAIPVIRRVFGWEDMAFNVFGILIGVPLILLAAKGLGAKSVKIRN
jgi:hypothetical protein